MCIFLTVSGLGGITYLAARMELPPVASKVMASLVLVCEEKVATESDFSWLAFTLPPTPMGCFRNTVSDTKS